MNDSPQDPFTALQASAAQLHELFLSYVNAGFSREEALGLAGVILSAGVTAAIWGEPENDIPAPVRLCSVCNRPEDDPMHASWGIHTSSSADHKFQHG